MTTSAILVFAGALMITAGSPGPSIAALVSRVLTNGVREVLPFLLAMWCGEIIWLTCAVAGLTAILHTFSTVFVILKYAGVIYLLYLAGKMWFALANFSSSALPTGQSRKRMFLAGLTVTLGNPKIMLFYLSLLPTIVDLSGIGITQWAQLAMTILVVLASVDLAWATLASRTRKLLKSRRAVSIANRTSAAMMVGAAATIAAR